MTFNSYQYALFFPSVLVAYWLLPRKEQQNLLLLVASYVFYGAWDARFLGLLAISTLIDYGVGRGLEVTESEGRRRAILATSICANLGILGFFKYFNFFVDSAHTLLGSLGLNIADPAIRILLPVGISFYTFQSMSYGIDVYRRRIEPEHNLLTYATFVAFFPQLVAGPIERAAHMLPQYRRRRTLPSWSQARSGVLLILLGLFKKVAIADAVAGTVQQTFKLSGSAGWLKLVAGVYLFAIQIYADFSGYTDIARGSARLLGIELMVNFEQPYLSRNITEFWRRWHISLSTWLRDYLYIPLGGNRRGARRTVINLMITMVLGGLWHGAAWTFVVWGALHGTFLAVHHLFRKRPDGGTRERFTRADVIPTIATFHLVCLAWIFFRATSFSQAMEYLRGIVTLRGGGIGIATAVLLLVTGSLTLLIDVAQRWTRDQTPMLRWPAVPRGAFYGVCLVGILLFSGSVPTPFIYFRF